MSQRRAEKLKRRAKRKAKKVEWRADQRFEDAVKIAESIARDGGVTHDDRHVYEFTPALMEAYRAGRLREAMEDLWRRGR